MSISIILVWKLWVCFEHRRQRSRSLPIEPVLELWVAHSSILYYGVMASMIHIVAGNPHWCPWFLLPSETISVVCVAKINANVHDTCSLKESMLMSTFGLSMLLVAAMHREAAVQGYLCLQSQWEWDILKVSCQSIPTSPPKKKKQCSYENV